MVEDSGTMQANMLYANEQNAFYWRERKSWTKNQAILRVFSDSVSPSSNIIGSHIAYSRNTNKIPKNMIVLWE